MQRYRYTASLGNSGRTISEDVDFTDDVTTDELDDDFDQWVLEQVEGGWEELS